MKRNYPSSLFVLLTFSSAWATAQNTQITIGGISDSSSTAITSNLSWKNEENKNSRFGQNVDINTIYKTSDGVLNRNEINLLGKIKYDLNERHYLQTAPRYEYNKLGTYNHKMVIGVGHGYHLFKSEKIRLSFETSIAQALGKNLNQTVFRESIWTTYRLKNQSEITNKFLYEVGGNIRTIRNILSFNYYITESTLISLISTKKWEKSSFNTHVLSFNLGTNF